jgi:hypothetical protein
VEAGYGGATELALKAATADSWIKGQGDDNVSPVITGAY